MSEKMEHPKETHKEKSELQKRHDYWRYIFDLMMNGNIHQDDMDILYRDEEKYKTFLAQNLSQ